MIFTLCPSCSVLQEQLSQLHEEINQFKLQINLLEHELEVAKALKRSLEVQKEYFVQKFSKLEQKINLSTKKGPNQVRVTYLQQRIQDLKKYISVKDEPHSKSEDFCGQSETTSQNKSIKLDTGIMKRLNQEENDNFFNFEGTPLTNSEYK